MNELISIWLSEQGLNSNYIPSAAIAVGISLIFVIASLSYYLAKHQVLSLVHKLIINTKNTWDDALIEHNVLARMTLLVPLVLILFLTPLILEADTVTSNLTLLLSKVLLTFQISRCISAMLNVGRSISQESAKQRFLPLNAIIQMIKLALYLVASIVIVSLIINRSPVYLLSGLGALTAVLLLIFQDTIKGLVASIQISANRMVVAGDWIELPKYGADGDVLEIGLSTVKIENFDKTITTVPTYALISDSFKNWRNMYHTGARRIKRTVIIDIASIDFYSAEQINQLTNAHLLQGYLSDKKQELAQNGDNSNSDEIAQSIQPLNSRQLTNIGTFRAYITKYLQENSHIRSDLTCMVRQLTATQTGLPLEIYCFANTTNWLDYEAIQADIFDHLFAIAPQFDLRVFQHPSGHDWQNNHQ
ncbi:mechanosensitive ion channel family protein [Colwellia psychrerythraea]|uniref:Mechanosensing system component YbdG n=1 Tax=Colwellia psychrerythraea TaxID=28229 RepID=A0A099KN94_COLPS|nr:mechanosensitive ion channel family protein [Colwellia psychrerythraea]KGJ92229.1 MscS Mechanosensitive ion channel [Colwellia psychrerythraea]